VTAALGGSSPAGHARLSRRALLSLPPLALAAACTDSDPDPVRAGRSARPPAPPPPDPDDAPRAAAVARERTLVQHYDATITALPALAGRLAPLRTQHQTHLAALLGTTASPSTSPAAQPSAGAVAVPATPAAALSALSALERSTGQAHGDACLTVSRALAGVLASLSASELSHPLALS
jgi:hypothetical protein